MKCKHPSYCTAYEAISTATPRLDASVVSRSIQQFPVLRLHACELICNGNVDFYSLVAKAETLDNICHVFGEIVAPRGQSWYEEKCCAKRILRYLQAAGDAVLSRIVLRSARKPIISEGCAFFVSCFLEEAPFSAKCIDELVKDICRNIRLCKRDIVSVASNSVCTRLDQLVVQLEDRNRGKKDIGATTASHLRPAPQVCARVKRPRLFVESHSDRESQNTNNLGSLGVNVSLQRGPFCLDDLYPLLNVVALYVARPHFLLKLIHKYDVAHFLVDVVICFLGGYLSPFHAMKNTVVRQANIHSSSLLRHLLLIVDHDPAVNVYTYHLHGHGLNEYSDDGTQTYAEMMSAHVEFLVRRCASMSAHGKLDVLDTSALTRHLVHLYLLGTNSFEEWPFKIYSWMAISDIVDCSFTAISRREYSLQKVIGLWNALSKNSPNPDRSAEIDYMFVSRLTMGNQLRIWLGCSATNATKVMRNGSNTANEICDENASVPNVLSSLTQDLAATLSLVASRMKQHAVASWKNFESVVSVLEARFVWEVAQRKPDRSLGQAFSNGLDLICALIDSIPGQETRNRGLSSLYQLRICKCGGFFAAMTRKDCMCLNPQWRCFNRPDSDCWFFWTVVGTKLSENDSVVNIKGRRELLTAAMFLPHHESGRLTDKFTLLRSVCSAIFSAAKLVLCIDTELRPCDQELPVDVKLVLLKLIGEADSSRGKILREIDSCVREIFVRDEELITNNSTPQPSKEHKVIRVAFDAIWQCYAKVRQTTVDAFFLKSELVLIEGLLQLFYPCIEEFNAYMDDMPSFMELAYYAAMAIPAISTRRPLNFVYLPIVRGYRSRFCKGESQYSVARDTLAQNVFLCFEI